MIKKNLIILLIGNYPESHSNNNKHTVGNSSSSLEIKYNLEDIQQQLYFLNLSISMVDIQLCLEHLMDYINLIQINKNLDGKNNQLLENILEKEAGILATSLIKN